MSQDNETADKIKIVHPAGRSFIAGVAFVKKPH